MSGDKNPSVAILLLAAGESRRMGAQKQLLPINGKPMVRLSAELARRASPGPLIVVVGSQSEDVTRALDGLDAYCVFNPEWAEGMGASLRQGVRTLLQRAPASAAMMIMLADQPGISSAHLDALLACHRAHPGQIIASETGGVPQPPALFPSAWFERLAALQGDRGARALLREAANDVQLVHTESIRDVDTPGDYDQFISDTSR